MSTAVRIQGVGKRYRISHSAPRNPYRTVRETLMDLASAPLRCLGRRLSTGRDDEFWALREVCAEIKVGDVVGIIGHNGAGKSTLLKILSRIARPTTGRVEIRGRVSCLLEVGTGFHPELTGRENVYLNGAILGMTRREIDRRFDEIVAFSEIAPFLDTPVKRYSSGMTVRLAFSVAAHLEPEVLIVDEVLAVGDASFQRKCLGQMGRIAHEGRTVLFVSHDMNSIARLARSAILLERGEIVARGLTDQVVREYLGRGDRSGLEAEWRRGSDTGTGKTVELRAVRVRSLDGLVTPNFRADESILVEIDLDVAKTCHAQIAFRLNRQEDGQTIFTTALSDAAGERASSLMPGLHVATCVIPAPFLPPGSYHLLVAANNPRGPQHDLVERVLRFEVSDVGSPRSLDRRLGYLTPVLEWRITPMCSGLPPATVSPTRPG
jgi:lipopolysaccharide transport system ATP-binding protein